MLSACSFHTYTLRPDSSNALRPDNTHTLRKTLVNYQVLDTSGISSNQHSICNKASPPSQYFKPQPFASRPAHQQPILALFRILTPALSEGRKKSSNVSNPERHKHRPDDSGATPFFYVPPCVWTPLSLTMVANHHSGIPRSDARQGGSGEALSVSPHFLPFVHLLPLPLQVDAKGFGNFLPNWALIAYFVLGTTSPLFVLCSFCSKPRKHYSQRNLPIPWP